MSGIIEDLTAFGQSVWLDNISRSHIATGRLRGLIDLGLSGITSNPSIFNNAISKSTDYDEEVRKLSRAGKTDFEIYDDLTVRDIQDATDMFREVYEESGRLDGYVSLEINPKLASLTRETVAEGKRLHKRVARANVMFKVPSTTEGFPAIDELIASGINVNVTLIFSLGQYIETARAYMRGLKRLIDGGGDASKVRSVASVFVSRIDSATDKLLDERAGRTTDPKLGDRLAALRGRAAVANSALIYREYLDLFASDEFKTLARRGANVQRLLWGSTSTKDPSYDDLKYVTDLIGQGTVNTMPDKTLEAFLDHGKVKEALTSDARFAEKVVSDLKDVGIDIDEVCADLLSDGVVKFEAAFDSLLGSVRTKMRD
jgi:transaldolase